MIEPIYFQLIIDELKANPLPVSNYRQRCSTHKQSVFGVVARRNVPADYSKLCSSHPTLYKHLLEFGRNFSGTPFNSIIISEGHTSIHKRMLKGAVGFYTVVPFDEGVGGTLIRNDIPQSINATTAYTIVFYTTSSPTLPPPSVVSLNDADVFMRGSEPIVHTGRKIKKELNRIWIECKHVVVNFP
jgi:hypothetical protein